MTLAPRRSQVSLMGRRSGPEAVHTLENWNLDRTVLAFLPRGKRRRARARAITLPSYPTEIPVMRNKNLILW